MTLRPAYGRDYKSAKAVKEDCKAGKDFIIADVFHGSGQYINVQDAPKGETIMVRYAADRKIVQVQ